jgi:hypothetical protein
VCERPKARNFITGFKIVLKILIEEAVSAEGKLFILTEVIPLAAVSEWAHSDTDK